MESRRGNPIEELCLLVEAQQAKHKREGDMNTDIVAPEGKITCAIELPSVCHIEECYSDLITLSLQHHTSYFQPCLTLETTAAAPWFVARTSGTSIGRLFLELGKRMN
jgi:hypothetical protein